VAVAFDAAGAGAKGTTVTTITWSHTNSAASNALTVGLNYPTGTTPQASAVSYGGVALARLGSVPGNNVGPGGIEHWGKIGSLPTGANTVSCSVTSSADNKVGGSVSATIGGVGAFGTAQTSFTSGTTIAYTHTGTTAGNLLIVAASQGNGSGVMTATSPGTTRFAMNGDSSEAADNVVMGTWAAPGGSQSVGFSENATSDFWGLVSVEVQDTGGGGGAPSGQGAANPLQRARGRHGRPLRRWMRTQRVRREMAPPALAIGAGLAAGTGVAPNVTQAGANTYITGLGGSGAGYFIDNRGNPRLVWGDALWGLCGNAGRWNSGNWQADYDGIIANRAAQGFTAIYTKPMGTTQNLGINDDGRTFDPLYPFQGGTPSTGVSLANPSTGLTANYWARIDYLFTRAAANNITIFLNAIGYNSDFTSSGPLAGKSSTEFQAYGTALGNRYKNTPNLIWVVADDYFGSVDTLISAFLTGLRGTGDTHPIAIENMAESDSKYIFQVTDTGCGTTNGNATVTDSNATAQYVGAAVSGSGIQAGSVISSVSAGVSFTMNKTATATATVSLKITDQQTSWGYTNAQYNFEYSYNQAYYGVEESYKETSPLTVLQGDGYFYQGGSAYDTTYDRAFRQDAWWALASGAVGKISGSESMWQYQSSALASSATDWWYANNSLAIVNAFTALPGWHLLVPDTANALITGGRGTRATGFDAGGGGGQYEPAFTSGYVAASRTPDGGSGSSLAVIYMPLATTITIDQTKMAAGYTATWVDPVTGATSSATPGSTYNSTAKGNNSRSQPDWVLVLQGPTAVSATAGLASGSGTAPGVTLAASVQAGLASGTGSAPAITPAATVAAGLASGTGTAPAITLAGSVKAGLASGTGSAPSPSVSTASSTSASAGLASGTGTAPTPAAAPVDQPAAGLASGTGQAPAVTLAASVKAGLGSGTGSAPAITPAATATVGLAAATGSAPTPAAAPAAAPVAGLASGTGQAPSITLAATAKLGLAAGTGSAPAVQLGASATVGLASATGTAPSPSVSTSSSATAQAGLAAGTGSAPSPAVTATVSPVAGLASGAGSAPAVGAAVSVRAGLAAGAGSAAGVGLAASSTLGLASSSGSAYAVTAQTSAAYNAVAGLAAGTGQAPAVTLAATVRAGLASGTGSAPAVTPAITVQAGLASATGTAPSVTLAASATVGLASAAGSAPSPAVATSVAATVGLAAGTGTAPSPSVSTVPQFSANAGVASATGSAPTPVAAPVAQAAAGQAGAAGAAFRPAAQAGFTAFAGLATGTGSAPGPALTLTSSPAVGLAAGTGQAPGAVGQPAKFYPAGNAAGTGTAYGAQVTLAARPSVAVAAGNGQALSPFALGLIPAVFARATASGTAKTPAGVTGAGRAASASGGQSTSAAVSGDSASRGHAVGGGAVSATARGEP